MDGIGSLSPEVSFDFFLSLDLGLLFQVRFLSLDELERLQGFSKGVEWPSDVLITQRGSMVGNAMALPALKAAMDAVLRSAGLLK